VKEPLCKNDFEDFYLFSDNTVKLGIKSCWKQVSLEVFGFGEEGMNANRFFKMHPKDILPDYPYSIYIDGNVLVVSDVSSLCSIAKGVKSGIAMHRHNERDCVYLEAEVCKLFKRGNAAKIDEQMKKYKAEGFPEHFGLFEATIIVVDLKNTLSRKILNDWWNEFKTSGSGRDQLAFPYVIWKNGLKMEDVGVLGNCVDLNPKFRRLDLGDHANR
jgi:hypothetical protein